MEIRVLQLGSPTGMYGAERWIVALAGHLPAEIRSCVASIKDSENLEVPLCKHAAELGIETRIFEAHGKLSLPALVELRRFIKGEQIDVLHSHGYKTDIIGLLATFGTTCKTVSTPHGWSANAGLKLTVYEWLDRIALLFFDAVVPLSQELYRGLHRIPGMQKRLHLIPNGVDLKEIEANSGASLRPPGDVVIGFIGQLIRRKRVDTLIEAFHLLKIPGKRLRIVGEGPERRKLESLAAELGERDRVEFLGYRPDRLSLLRGFDVFVLPSELEGIPRCLMEAMAVGVPVIASAIPGCLDLVSDGLTGLLFGAGDSCMLADRLLEIIASASLRDKLAESAKDHVRRRHSASRMAQEYAGLYQTLVRTRR